MNRRTGERIALIITPLLALLIGATYIAARAGWLAQLSGTPAGTALALAIFALTVVFAVLVLLPIRD